jgi:hypothetical protein
MGHHSTDVRKALHIVLTYNVVLAELYSSALSATSEVRRTSGADV